ncbi:MAG TPA: FAD-binding protein [Candidatus Dormibacteraeota bacterium]|nr:FAD-binding protein [Candidatus Dormibacteraeota bacterium]
MTDVLVVGGGLAALAAALEAAEAGASVVVTSAGPGSSELAQGGIAAAVGCDDSPELHEADTLSAGAGVCDAATVRMLVAEAPRAVAWLEAHGLEFDTGAYGQRALLLEAAHSRPRVLHAGGDGSGAAIVFALRREVEAIRRRGRLRWINGAWLEGLLKADDLVTGARLRLGDERIELQASVTVLATGGYAGLFARSTTTSVCHGAGLVAALEAGAEVADLEFVQFHPTAYAGPPGTFLLTEALRGAGARLVDADGRRFLLDADPRGELATRATVARAIASHLRKTGANCVFLDATPIGETALRQCFPGFVARCQRLGIDPRRDPVPVAPAAHYTMGGIVVDIWGRTRVPGLLAAGECARSGAHGANRLASNSLLEAVVLGRLAGRTALVAPSRCGERATSIEPEALSSGGLRFEDVSRLLTASAGPLRSAVPMLDGLHRLNGDQGCSTRAEAARRLACLVLQSALTRRESRGAHVRDDYPNESIDWQPLEVAVRRAAGSELRVEVRPRARSTWQTQVSGLADQRQSSMTAIVRPSSKTA